MMIYYSLQTFGKSLSFKKDIIFLNLAELLKDYLLSNLLNLDKDESVKSMISIDKDDIDEDKNLYLFFVTLKWFS